MAYYLTFITTHSHSGSTVAAMQGCKWVALFPPADAILRYTPLYDESLLSLQISNLLANKKKGGGFDCVTPSW